MNLVKTYIAQSGIQGIGLFAGEFIPKGKKIWELNLLDICLLPDVWKYYLSDLAEDQVKYVKRYAYFNDGEWIYCGDDAKFTNHSNIPNTSITKYEQYAITDIGEGEEITCNYHSLDKDFTEEEFNEQ